MVSTYIAYNGVFEANRFVQHVFGHNQHIRYCDVNGNHQYGVSERSIYAVSKIARAVML